MLAIAALGTPIRVAGSAAPISIAGSTAFETYVHNVQAVLGPTAVLQSDTNVTVDTSSTNYSQVIADGTVMAPVNLGKVLAVGVAVALGSFDNTALATVETGGSIDATGAVQVSAELTYPDLSQVSVLIPANSNTMTALATALNGRGGVDTLFNVWAHTSSTAVKIPASVSVTGSFGSATYTDDVEAIVEPLALINQHRHADGQSVAVLASSTMSLLNLAGVVKLQLDTGGLVANAKAKSLPISPIGNQAGQVGVGGSVLLQAVHSTTVARIESGARVDTGAGPGGGLQVAATENVQSVNLAQSGGASGFFGLSGSVSVVDHNSSTLAKLDSGVQVSGGLVNMKSKSDISYYNIAGAAQIAGTFGVGTSTALNRVTRNTAAVIGTEITSTQMGPGNAGTIINATGLSIDASNTGNITGVSVAGAIADKGTAKQTSQQIPISAPVEVGVAGAVGINEINDTTKSYINDNAKITLANGALELDSNDNTSILATTGSLSLAARNMIAIGLAGSISKNTLDATTESFVAGADVRNVGAATLNAQRQGSVMAVTIAAAGTAPSPLTSVTVSVGITVDVAASISLNTIGGTTRAFISNGDVQATGGVKLTATDTSTIAADGGGAAIALSLGGSQAVGVTIAAGVSVAINNVTSTVAAFLDNAPVSGDAITISAANSSTINAVTPNSVRRTLLIDCKR